MAESRGPVPRRGYATPAGLESPVLYDSGAPAVARSGPGSDGYGRTATVGPPKPGSSRAHGPAHPSRGYELYGSRTGPEPGIGFHSHGTRSPRSGDIA